MTVLRLSEATVSGGECRCARSELGGGETTPLGDASVTSSLHQLIWGEGSTRQHVGWFGFTGKKTPTPPIWHDS